MAIAFRDELHRLVDDIPDTRPETARVLFELGLLVVFASHNDDALFRRLRQELTEAQAEMGSPDEAMARLVALRDRWVHGPPESDDALLQMLESAPPDDEPLTPDEIALLDARRTVGASGTTFSHDEVGRKLQS